MGEVVKSSVDRYIANAEKKIIELEAIPRADKRAANKAALLIEGSYLQNANDPEIYHKQLVNVLHNAPLADVIKVGTHEGILATCKFLPSIAEVLEWLWSQDRWRIDIIDQSRADIEQLSAREHSLRNEPRGLKDETVQGWQ